MSDVPQSFTAYTADSNSAAEVFGIHSPTLYWNHPRVPFEYYIDVNIAGSEIALSYYKQYFPEDFEFTQILPLIKTIEMPSMKIDTVALNQYNRRRLVQSKVQFDPIKMVFHDVADGKTLKFWQMYYTYYFRDGLEPGVNSSLYDSNKQVPVNNYSNPQPTASPINTDGVKSCINNVLTEDLVNHNFGYNLLNSDGSWPEGWNKTKDLIKTIVIYQVHGGAYNKVTLVNPRITSFAHDTLNYAAGDRTLEMTFTIEYEYAYYETFNEMLDETQLSIFDSKYMDIARPVFNVSTSAFKHTSGTNNFSTGNNLQRALNSKLGQAIVGSLAFDVIPGNRITTSTSSLSGILNIRPLPIKDLLHPAPLIKSFKHTTLDNLKTLGATSAKERLQSSVSSAQDFVVGSVTDGISSKKAYVPTDLSSPIKGATPGII